MREMFGDMQLQSNKLRQEKSGSDVVAEQWSNGEATPSVIEVRPLLSHSITPLLHFSTSAALANQPPVRIEGPVNKQAAPNEIFFRHRSPITAVLTVVSGFPQGGNKIPW